MAYKALYRTYRPSTFDEVAGQQHIVKTIQNALATGKIAHAYLFAGPRGTGKTTMAKLFAKALNCEHGTGCQCNECKNCTSINEGTHPDVLELDAASNNSVEDIRDLIDRVKYGTILGRTKVYIIDEVHMLSTGAFNALLKTLEEPPEHVIFVLATTEPHKILPTILSRCQRYDFSKVGENDIRERVKVVLNKEGISYEEDAINLIISLADGGMRDALSILDQVLAYSGNTLNVKDILDIFSLESTAEKLNLLSSIVNKDIQDVLKRLKNYIEKGTDIKRLTNDLLLILKDMLIYQTSSNVDFLEVLKEDEVSSISRLMDSSSIMKMIDVLMETLKDYKNVNDINPLFEVTLLKLASIETSKTTAKPQPIVKEEPKIEVVKEVKIIKEEPKPIEVPKQEIVTPVATPVVQKEEPIVEEQTSLFDFGNFQIDDEIIYIKNTDKDDSFVIDDSTMIDIMVTAKKDIKNSLLDEWKNLKVLTAHPTLSKSATMLIDGRPLVASNKVVVLEFASTSIVEKVNLIANQKDLQNVLFNTFKRKMFVYAVNRSESVRLQQKYMNVKQLGKLPKADTITINYVGE
jgi:DNA polymerase-3 subunit gamma/tau